MELNGMSFALLSQIFEFEWIGAPFKYLMTILIAKTRTMSEMLDIVDLDAECRVKWYILLKEYEKAFLYMKIKISGYKQLQLPGILSPHWMPAYFPIFCSDQDRCSPTKAPNYKAKFEPHHSLFEQL